MLSGSFGFASYGDVVNEPPGTGNGLRRCLENTYQRLRSYIRIPSTDFALDLRQEPYE
jgi:hypothetical protein